MARLQTNSGGFALDPTIRYAVYISLTAPTQAVAILDTEPDVLPGGYDAWMAGSGQGIAIIDGTGMTMLVGSVEITGDLIEPPIIEPEPPGVRVPGGARPTKVRRFYQIDDDEEPDQEPPPPPKPTKRLIRQFQRQILDDAEGLLGTKIPQHFNPPVREAIKGFWNREANWHDLQRNYDALLAETVARIKRDEDDRKRNQQDEDDIETILLTHL